MLLHMNRYLILPPLGDAAAIFDFGMTFNGYEAFGSFEACAAAAKARKRETLDDLRNELFFACRASRHTQDDAYVDFYAELRPLFVKLLSGSP
jgi:hypothetical protein